MLTRNLIYKSVAVQCLLRNSVYITTHCFSLDCSVRRQKEQLQENFSPQNSKLLKVAMIGLPNVGKSTLINRLMEYDVCPASQKPHTTRDAQRAIYLENNIQVVFVDTPGVINRKEKKKFKMDDTFFEAPLESVREADLVAVMHDVTNKILRNKLDPRVLAVLQKFPNKPSVLIVNKIDILKHKRKLLETVFYLSEGMVNGKPIPLKAKPVKVEIKQESIFERTRFKIQKRDEFRAQRHKGRFNEDELQTPLAEEETHQPLKSLEQPELTPELCELQYNRLDEAGRIVRGWPNFKDVFLISALSGDGVDLIKTYFRVNAKSSDWAYSDDILTDVPPAALCLRIIKAKMLELMQHELPYLITPQLDYWDTDSTGTLRISVRMEVPSERYLRIAIGTGGTVINTVTNETEKNLIQLLKMNVKLNITVMIDPKVEKSAERRGKQ